MTHLDNTHPADRLLRVRADIARLEAEADRLRTAILELPRDRLTGANARAEVRTQTRRVFLRDRLPPDILTCPSYWDRRESHVVRVHATDPVVRRGPVPVDDVLEPFGP